MFIMLLSISIDCPFLVLDLTELHLLRSYKIMGRGRREFEVIAHSDHLIFQNKTVHQNMQSVTLGITDSKPKRMHSSSCSKKLSFIGVLDIST